MRYPWVNLALLALLLLQAVSGYLGFTSGREPEAWLLWLHGAGAYALVLLTFYKGAVILDAWRRKKTWTGRRLGFLIVLLLFVLTMALGLAWTFAGPRYVAGFSLVSLHIYIAVPLMLLMLWHAWHMRFIWRVREATGRRLFLNAAAGAVAGLVLWLAVERAKALAGLPGATRRFTGSYEAGSFTRDFPQVSWIADRPPAVEAGGWRLRLEGEVECALLLSYSDLETLPQVTFEAALDCTGGWYTVQRWRGVSVGELLREAGLRDPAASVTFESLTGYRRRFSVEQARDFVLALGIVTADGYAPLGRGHGFPARLVAPGERGVEWVKWVAALRVNGTGPLWQSPLPLQ